jgi:hypothetical protein
MEPQRILLTQIPGDPELWIPDYKLARHLVAIMSSGGYIIGPTSITIKIGLHFDDGKTFWTYLNADTEETAREKYLDLMSAIGWSIYKYEQLILKQTEGGFIR